MEVEKKSVSNNEKYNLLRTENENKMRAKSHHKDVTAQGVGMRNRSYGTIVSSSCREE